MDRDLAEKERHSRIELAGCALAGHVVGVIAGTLQGFAGSVAILTATRMANQSLDGSLDEVFGGEGNTYDRVGDAFYHYTRLATKFGIYGTALYKMGEDLLNGGDVGMGWLALPNLVSAGYEIYRWRRTAGEEGPSTSPLPE